jgi:hypothetical protein
VTVIPGSPCANVGPHGSIDPGWLSGYNFSKVEVWKKLRDRNVIRYSNVINPADYKTRVNRVNPSIVLKATVTPINNYKPPAEINSDKIKDQTYLRNIRMR